MFHYSPARTTRCSLTTLRCGHGFPSHYHHVSISMLNIPPNERNQQSLKFTHLYSIAACCQKIQLYEPHQGSYLQPHCMLLLLDVHLLHLQHQLSDTHWLLTQPHDKHLPCKQRWLCLALHALATAALPSSSFTAIHNLKCLSNGIT